MTLNKTEFSDENRVNITTFIDQTTSIAYHGNGGSGDGIPISIQPYFEPMEDNTANGFYAKVKVYTDDAETPHFEGEPQRIGSGSNELFRSNNAWEFELPDQVGCYPDFRVEYYASLTEDGEYEKMDEGYSGRLYVLFNKPYATTSTDERLLYFGCKQAHGAKTQQEVIDGIWRKFVIDNENPTGNLRMNDFNPNGTDNSLLKYYKPEPSPSQTYSDLIEGGNGDCEAFAKLFENLLLFQGIQAKWQVYTSSGRFESILVQQWDFIGDGTRGSETYPYVNLISTNLSKSEPDFNCETGEYSWVATPDVHRVVNGINNASSQGNMNPRAHFGSHWLVEVGDSIYDPSYGCNYNSIDEFVESSVAGYYIGGGGTVDEVNHSVWYIRQP